VQGDRRPKRLLIINELRDRELSVSELCEALDLSQSNASQHLAILRERGVVSARREGTSVIYTLRGRKVLEAVDLLREFLAEDLAERARLGGAISG
jgi:DNA-binding transcriptional ArsR family regulator